MEDVLDVYELPYNPQIPVVCMDEKPYQLLGEARDSWAMRPGDDKKVDSEYVRNGTCSIFAFVEPLGGMHHVSVREHRTALDWAEEIQYLVDVMYPNTEKIILVMDNLNTHKPASLYKKFPPAEARRILRKLEIHYTPKHGSWLDIAEIELNVMTRQCLTRRIDCIETLKTELAAWEARRNDLGAKVNWQFRTKDARIKLISLYTLDYICKQISHRHEFQYDLCEILCNLVCSRILNPASKLATFEYVQSFLEKPSYELKDLYRALEVIGDEKDYIQSALYKFSKEMGQRNDRVLYYDCTNYYFEIEQEKGELRKYGPSKEHRPNPIVEMGLFMDGDGIPLAFCVHSGNTNEQKTLRPLEEQIMGDFGHSKFIVCTDAGLSSAANRRFNDKGERAFITTQSIKKMKAFQREWALSPQGWHLPNHKETFNLNDIITDETLREKYYNWTFYKEEWFHENDIEQNYIVTFSLKYMDYQRTIRNEQILRAERALNSTVKRERTRQSDYKRFITKISVTDDGEVASKAVYGLNEEKIRDEEQYDGFYAVATNLLDPAEEIIRINHRRWEIEECFRIMKHEFDARPVYLRRDTRITAHFTTCFLALTIFRYLEKRLGNRYTCEEIIMGLRSLKFRKLKDAGYIPCYIRTELTDALHDAFGFRTDYEIISRADMRRIIVSGH